MGEIDQIKILRARIDSLDESAEAAAGRIEEVNDGLTDDIEDLRETVRTSVTAGTFYVTLNPSETTELFIWDARNKQRCGWTAGRQCYCLYTVEEGKTYFVSGTTESGAASYPLIAFYDENNTWLLSEGTEINTVYTDYEVTAPEGAVKAVVNTCAYITVGLPVLKEGVTAFAKSQELDRRLAAAENRTYKAFYPTQMDAILREAEKNPFAFSEFDKGYVSFVFDDLRRQQDSIASIFEEFNFPLCLAAIPNQLQITANGLSQARGNFTPGMTMKAVCDQVVANGGEIMTHNADVVTATNQYDYDFMWNYFVGQKLKLEDAGYTIRGLIRAGGTGFIQRSAETARWAAAYYEYSDFGYLPNHRIDRININQSLATIKAAIDDAVASNRWIQFYGHDYDYGNGETLTGEADLREILQYCEDSGIEVVTYSYIFDHFSSSYLAENASSGGELEPGGYVYEIATPTQHLQNTLWNAQTNSAYTNTAAQYDCKKYAVAPGEKYLVTGGSSSYPAAYPCASVYVSASSSSALEKYGTDSSTKYTDLEITIPAGATILVLNCYDGGGNPATSATKVTRVTVDYLQQQISALTARVAALEGGGS